MAVKNSIFGSGSEARGFQSIQDTWGKKYKVYPQIPFSVLFERDSSIRDSSNFFFKTSVDYVLCTKQNRPLLAIDFDGLGGGFSKSKEYIQVRSTEDPQRKWKFDYKIQYALKDSFPYYVVASDEFRYLGETKLTVVDGLIGSEIAKLDFRKRISSIVYDRQDIIDSLPPHEQREYIQDLVIDQEIESDFAHNPVIQKTKEVRSQISEETGSVPTYATVYRHSEKPPLPELKGDGSFFSKEGIESLEARVTAMGKIKLLGCTCVLENTPVGEVSGTAWMRNYNSYSLITEIAELLAWSKLARLLQK